MARNRLIIVDLYREGRGEEASRRVYFYRSRAQSVYQVSEVKFERLKKIMRKFGKQEGFRMMITFKKPKKGQKAHYNLALARLPRGEGQG